MAVTQFNKTRRINSSRGKLTVCGHHYYLFEALTPRNGYLLLHFTVTALFYTVIILSGHMTPSSRGYEILTSLKGLKLAVQVRAKQFFSILSQPLSKNRTSSIGYPFV